MPQSIDFATWADRVLTDPLSGLWLPALGVLLVVGLLLYCVVLTRLLRDWLALHGLSRVVSGGGAGLTDDLVTIPSTRGLVGAWVHHVRVRSESNMATSQEQLETLAEARYRSLLGMADQVRGSATLLGLLFTFIGLALGLDELAEMMKVAGAESAGADPVYEVLDKIKDVLPKLGLAFSSSIGGVAVAFVLGLIGGVMDALCLGTVARVAALSSTGLEPALGAASGAEDLALQLRSHLENQKEAQTSLEAALGRLERALAKQTSAATQSVARDGRLSESMEGMTKALGVQAAAMASMPNRVADEMSKAAQTLHDGAAEARKTLVQGAGLAADALTSGGGEVTKAMQALRGGAEEARKLLEGGADAAGSTLKSASEDVATTIRGGAAEGAETLLKALDATGDRWTSVVEDAGAVRSQLTTHTQYLDELTSRVRAELEGVVVALNVSSEHIRSLETASTRFADALDSIEQIVDEAESDRNHLLRETKEAISSIRPMTEQVNHASEAAAAAASDLRSAFAGDTVRRYLDKLPELTELSQEETRNREAFIAASRQLEGIAEQAAQLRRLTDELGRSAVDYRTMLADTQGLAHALVENDLTPVLATLVRETTRAELGEIRSDWVPRVERQQRTSSEALQQLARTSEQMARTQRRLEEWIRQPAWRRIFNAGENDS